MSKHVGIVTGTRADYGLLSRTIKLLQADIHSKTTVFACGSHLSPEFGMTIKEIEDDGVQNIIPVEMLLSTDSRVGTAKSLGLATISFADVFSAANLDCLLVLGDRYEILAAAQSALLLGIPIAHIHGGELTEGAFDEAIRHSITKMASVHFPAANEFARRIRQLGEDPASIFVTGSPGIDNIKNEARLSVKELKETIPLSFERPLVLVTYHPVTNSIEENNIAPLVSAMSEFKDCEFIITYPNADGGGNRIIEQWSSLSSQENIAIVPSLGFRRYLSVMENVKCIVGNSSSGIIEAPSFKVPTINIGTRQDGRPMASSVINVSMEAQQIKAAFSKAMSDEFKKAISSVENPYGKGNTAEMIVDKLKTLEFTKFKSKKFWDLHARK